MIQKYFVLIWGMLGVLYVNIYIFCMNSMFENGYVLKAIFKGDFSFFTEAYGHILSSFIVGVIVGFLRKKKFVVLVRKKASQNNNFGNILLEGVFIALCVHLLIIPVLMVVSGDIVYSSFFEYPIRAVIMWPLFSGIGTFGTVLPFCILATWLLVKQAAKSIKEG